MIFTGQSPISRVILLEVEVLSRLSARVWFAVTVDLELIVRIFLISFRSQREREREKLYVDGYRLQIRRVLSKNGKSGAKCNFSSYRIS